MLKMTRRRALTSAAASGSLVLLGNNVSAQAVDLVIKVEFSEDRNQVGRLTLENAAGRRLAGPFPAFGRSDNARAAAHQNANRDPTKPYGDTPTGTYDIPRGVATGDPTRYRSHSYGPNGALVLKPKSGQALAAEANGRIGLLIHGGDPGANGRLRATHGCVRLSNSDMAALMAAIAAAGQNARFNRCELVRLSATVGPAGDPDSGEDTGDPPPGIGDLLGIGSIRLP